MVGFNQRTRTGHAILPPWSFIHHLHPQNTPHHTTTQRFSVIYEGIPRLTRRSLAFAGSRPERIHFCDRIITVRAVRQSVRRERRPMFHAVLSRVRPTHPPSNPPLIRLTLFRPFPPSFAHKDEFWPEEECRRMVAACEAAVRSDAFITLQDVSVTGWSDWRGHRGPSEHPPHSSTPPQNAHNHLSCPVLN